MGYEKIVSQSSTNEERLTNYYLNFLHLDILTDSAITIDTIRMAAIAIRMRLIYSQFWKSIAYFLI